MTAGPAPRPPFRLGLTGSIAMGKSTTAGLFAAEGIPVWDADAAVHRLYAAGGGAVAPVAALWPEVRNPTGGLDRARLRARLAADPGALARLEGIVHPLVARDRAAFLRGHAGGADLVLCDIPLLFETGAERDMDAVLVVTAPAALQMQRLRARPDFNPETVAAILARQMPDRDKRARATHIIETLSLDAARAGVQALIAWLRGPLAPRRPEAEQQDA